MNTKLTNAVLAGLGLLAAGSAQAFSTYFGEDINNSGPSVPLSVITNSTAAQSSFLASLTGVGVNDFESQATGASQPLTLNFPASLSATLSGGSGSVQPVTPGQTNGAGRYSIPSASSSKFWGVSAGGNGNFTVTFNQDIAAFGFFGIDIGDYGGQLSLQFLDAASAIVGNLTVPNTIGSGGSTDGSVLYFGAIAGSGELFRSIKFNTTTGGGDVFAFDNFTIGSLQQVKVPEPGSLALMGLGLLGLGLTRRRKTT